MRMWAGAVERFAAIVWSIGVASWLTEPRLDQLARLHVVFPSASRGLLIAGAALVAGGQAWLAVRLLFRPDRIGRVGSVILLAILTAALFRLGIARGWGASCGCLSALFEESVASGVLRNLIIAAAILLAGHLRRRVDSVTD